MHAGKMAYLEHDGVLAFAHRGGDRVAPENTMAAFADAVAQGYRYLETDVHASLDGEVYAFHDNDLSRMVGMDVAINQLPAAEIDALTDSFLGRQKPEHSDRGPVEQHRRLTVCRKIGREIPAGQQVESVRVEKRVVDPRHEHVLGF